VDAMPYELSKRLLTGRTIFLGSLIDDEVSNLVCAQLLGLHVDDPGSDIQLYVGSTGGSVTASLAVYDMIQFVKCDVATHALGEVAGTALLLVAAGARGKRTAMPHARFKFVRLTGSTQGTAADIEIQEDEIARLRNAVYSII
jgi:ATP-dependent Clp protease protease subunit